MVTKSYFRDTSTEVAELVWKSVYAGDNEQQSRRPKEISQISYFEDIFSCSYELMLRITAKMKGLTYVNDGNTDKPYMVICSKTFNEKAVTPLNGARAPRNSPTDAAYHIDYANLKSKCSCQPLL